MIHIDSESPAWMQNLDRFVFSNNMILLHGNTQDMDGFAQDGHADPALIPMRRLWHQLRLQCPAVDRERHAPGGRYTA